MESGRTDANGPAGKMQYGALQGSLFEIQYHTAQLHTNKHTHALNCVKQGHSDMTHTLPSPGYQSKMMCRWHIHTSHFQRA